MTTAFPTNLPESGDPIPIINENFLALAALGTYSHNAPADSGLTRGYSGGRWGGFAVADATNAFGASTTTYVCVLRSTGALDFSTASTHYNDGTNYAKVETVVSGATAITSVDDDRAGPGGIHGGGGVGGGGAPFTGGTLTSALNEAPTVTIASSATPAIGAAAGNSILLTGTTSVTGFDTIAAGAFRRVRFGGALTLTYNATSLVLPTAASILTAGGDVAEFLSLGSGNWFCTSYTRANGQSLASPAAPGVNSQSAAYTAVLGDANGIIYHPASDTTARTWTIPANSSVAFPVGTTLVFDNDIGAGALTIAITTDTMVLVGAAGTTGSRTIAAGGQATAYKATSTRWRINGTLLT